jgi:Histidine kinase-, DNA gyrase B-, and HSP90-like ATPase
MTDTVPLPSSIRVGSFFLETLTLGMYDSAFHCIREYVQNGFDAISDAIAERVINSSNGRVVVALSEAGLQKNLSISDNGIGIPKAEAVDRLVALGASTKRPQKHAGFRGIGRLAGIAYCTILRYRTKAPGEDVAITVEFDCARLRGFMAPGAAPTEVGDVIRQSVTASSAPAKKHEHFTEVHMIGLVGLGGEFTDAERLSAYLGQYCPVDYAESFPFAEDIRKCSIEYDSPLPTIEVELRVGRDRRPIAKPYRKSYATSAGTKPSLLRKIERVGSREHGWFGWFGVSDFPGEIPDESVAGVRFRQKNIQIGDEALIEEIAAKLTPKGTERRLQRWAVGEIFVFNTEVVPNARRDGFEDNEAWRAIQKDAEGVAATIVKLIRSSSKNRSRLNKTNSFVAAKRKQLAEESASLTASDVRSIDGELKAQLAKIERAVAQGADPKEASRIVSEAKALREELGQVDAQPDAPPRHKAVLDIVAEVLKEVLGATRANEIMERIRARLPK